MWRNGKAGALAASEMTIPRLLLPQPLSLLDDFQLALKA